MKIVFWGVVMLLVSQGARAASFCNRYEPPKGFTALLDHVNRKIEDFSSRKIVAVKADETLSKLIAVKSPLIMAWMKKRGLGSKSEDDIAREWRVYFTHNFILSKFPSADSALDGEVDDLVTGLLKEYFTSGFVEKMEGLFKKAKNAALKTLESQGAGDELLDRVKNIKLYWPKSLKGARNNGNPLDVIDWGIAYDPVANEINMGLHAYAYPNEETYLSVFAHEIGHSFDSCRWSAFFRGKWPYEPVGKCLRSPESVGAKTRDDRLLDKMVKEKKLGPDLAQSLKENPTCNKLAYPPIGIQADQLPEAFADWFSAEAMAQLTGLDAKNLRLDLCENKKLTEGSSYLSNMTRLDGIYFAHPKFRQASDSHGARYCSLRD